MTARANARYVHQSPYKIRRMLDLVRGRSVPDARAVLAFSDRRASVAISKVLESAIANAHARHALDPDELVVAEAFANEGPTLKRFRPRARGRAFPIRKRTCHITIALRGSGEKG